MLGEVSGNLHLDSSGPPLIDSKGIMYLLTYSPLRSCLCFHLCRHLWHPHSHSLFDQSFPSSPFIIFACFRLSASSAAAYAQSHLPAKRTSSSPCLLHQEPLCGRAKVAPQERRSHLKRNSEWRLRTGWDLLPLFCKVLKGRLER